VLVIIDTVSEVVAPALARLEAEVAAVLDERRDELVRRRHTCADLRTIPLTPRALERLEALYAVERARGFGGDDDFVFTTFRGGRSIGTTSDASSAEQVMPQVSAT
jgi:integrase